MLAWMLLTIPPEYVVAIVEEHFSPNPGCPQSLSAKIKHKQYIVLINLGACWTISDSCNATQEYTSMCHWLRGFEILEWCDDMSRA